MLLAQRPVHGLLGGTWQFPETPDPPTKSTMLGEITHTFSHKRITYVVHHVTVHRAASHHQEWVPLDQLHAYPLSAAQRKIEKLIPAA